MMIYRYKFGLFIILLAIFGCVSQPPGPAQTIFQPVDSEDSVFQQGEQRFKQGELDPALDYYVRYLGQFPLGRHVDKALYRIGEIYTKQGEHSAARSFFERVTNEFPHSAAADQARLAIIDLMLKDNQIDEAVQRTLEMQDGILAPETRHQVWQRLWELYRLQGALAEQTLYAYRLFIELPAPENERWGNRLEDAISQLGDTDIELLWDRLDDPRIRSLLMYRYAVVQVIQENYADALQILTAFQHTFPDHVYATEAADLALMLTQQLSFAPYTIGCLLPLSGPYALYGQRALQGIELALGLVQSGETQLPIRLVVQDTASDEREAVKGVKALAAAQVGAIIGPIITAPAAAREAQRLNIPTVTFTQKPNVTAIGDFIFRNFITPQSQVKTLVDYFTHHLGLHDFAILYPRETYGQTFMDYFWDEVVRQGGRVVGLETYDPQQTDFAETIQKLVGTYYPIPEDLLDQPVVRIEENPYFQNKPEMIDYLEDLLPDPVSRLTGLFHQDPDQDRAKGPAIGRSREEEGADPILNFDVLFIPDAPNKVGLILPQLTYHDVQDVYLVGTNLWHSQQLIEMTRDYAQNAVMADGFFKDSRNESVRRFVEQYRSIYNSDPGILEAFAFDTANLMFELLVLPRMQMRHQLRDAMKQVFRSDGATGAMAFADDGEVIKKLSLLRIKGSRFVEIPHP